jgi:hypothetical protein
MHKIPQHDYIDQMPMHIFYIINHTLSHLMIFGLLDFIIFLLGLLIEQRCRNNCQHFVQLIVIGQLLWRSLSMAWHLGKGSRDLGKVSF